MTSYLSRSSNFLLVLEGGVLDGVSGFGDGLVITLGAVGLGLGLFLLEGLDLLLGLVNVLYGRVSKHVKIG